MYRTPMIQESFPLSIGGEQVATEDQLLSKVEKDIEMPRATLKLCPIYKPSKEYGYLIK